MDNSQLAIIISVFSVVVAATSLGWNVYRDIILKPNVMVTFAVKNIYQEGKIVSPDYIGITGVNHGPGAVILNTIVLKQTSLWRKLFRKEEYAILIHDSDNPYSGKLPAKLEVGETLDLFVKFDNECFLNHPFTHLGLSDSFGRSNWAKKSAMKYNRAQWLEKFGNTAK